jgi:lambda repressor-like predicted transcriptional regulator
LGAQMANDALQSALATAHLTRADLAQQCGVDLRTVDRWLSDDQRVPHPRQRQAAATALGTEVEMIWPSIKGSLRRSPGMREIQNAWPTRSAMPSTEWAELVAGANRDVVCAGYTSYFLWLTVPNLRDTLRTKAEAGAKIRFLLGDPDSAVTHGREAVEAVPLTVGSRIAISLNELAPLRDVPGVEVRFSDRHISLSVWQFDDQMIVSTHIAANVGHDSPTYKLRRSGSSGLFEAYASHVETLWESARAANRES